jgi:CAAX prenyl protease-like protein
MALSLGLPSAMPPRMIRAIMSTDPSVPSPNRALWTHVLPFLAWIVIMSLAFTGPAKLYAIQAVAALALFVWLRPWTYYPPVVVSRLPVAVLVGVIVCVVWVLPETPWFSRFPWWQDLYLRWGVRPLGEITGVPLHSPYAPESCGWGLSLVKLAGSAFVIATLEEFFWRGFIYRWLAEREFTKVDPRARHLMAFAIMVVLFGLEHDRWLAGMIAGAAYGALYAFTRDLWAAIVAHVTTNLLLGVYVLAYGQYRFW